MLHGKGIYAETNSGSNGNAYMYAKKGYQVITNDASEYSYDEGQYYIGEGKPKSKIRGLGKMDVFLPSLLFICLSGIFCGMTIFAIIALF